MEFNDRITNLVKLGFFCVELDFPEQGWKVIEDHEGERLNPCLWMRQAPLVGDWVTFTLPKRSYMGKVAGRAFEAAQMSQGADTEEAIAYEPPGIFLFVKSLQPCPNPTEASIWEVEDEKLTSP